MASKSTSRRESPTQAAINLQNEFIARGWLTSAEVGMANGSRIAANSAMWASEHRKAGTLLGAWSPRERTYRHPDFQFDLAGRLKLAVKDLLAALATHADLTPEADKTGWHRVFWMYGTMRDLADKDGNPRSAAAVFATDPEVVIAFARKSVVVEVNDVW